MERPPSLALMVSHKGSYTPMVWLLSRRESEGLKSWGKTKTKQKDPSHARQLRKQKFSTILEKSAWLTYEMELPFFISTHAGCVAGQLTS